MRLHHSGLLALGLLSACGSDTSGPSQTQNVKGGGGQATVNGRVVGVTPPPDSTYVGLPGIQVVLVKVGDLPPDSGVVDPPVPPPPAPPPIDSLTLAPGTRGGVRPPVLGVMDSVPPDSGWTPPPPGPPPPPPAPGCGRSGDTVATTTSGADGKFSVANLPEGLYDIQVAGTAGSGYGVGFFCGLAVRAAGTPELNIFVPATH